ncbi:DoxX family protein [Nocardia tengchongensis]
MNIALWIVAGALAAMFAMAGVMKSTQPQAKLAEKLPWVADVSLPTLRVIGVAEVLGALGLILPAWTGIAPILTPLAAVGLAVIMALAAVTHARRKEPAAIVFNLVLLAASVFVAWGRFGPYAY